MQNPPTPQKMSKALARKRLIAWFRALTLVLLLFFPARMFLQAGRQIDLNKNLFAAIRRNDAPRVTFLLNAGADANAREPLQDDRSMLRQIFDGMRGLRLSSGPSPLLVQFSVQADTKNSDIWHALPENTAITSALLAHHADPNVRDSGQMTPLILATQQDKEATVQTLLKGGARADSKDGQGADALYSSIANRTINIARMLLDAGTDVNRREGVLQNTPIMDAVTIGNVPLTKLLISRGADVNATDKGKKSVLSYATDSGSRSVIALLKAAGAK